MLKIHKKRGTFDFLDLPIYTIKTPLKVRISISTVFSEVFLGPKNSTIKGPPVYTLNVISLYYIIAVRVDMYFELPKCKSSKMSSIQSQSQKRSSLQFLYAQYLFGAILYGFLRSPSYQFVP